VRGRLVLRPGLRVFRRDDEHLQVGFDGARVVLPDSAGVRTLLRELTDGTGVTPLTPEAGLALGRLVEAGLVVERTDLTTAARSHRGVATAAVFAAHGPEAPARLAARATCVIEVIAPAPWAAATADHLAASGLSTADDTGRPTVTMVISPGEPARSRLDQLMREDRTHLLVVLGPDRARVGPLVVPGATACLRCVDAHLSEQDPRRGLLLEQLEDRTGSLAPCDPVLGHAALALAVRDLTTYAEGGRPATWSATLDLDTDLTLPRRTWPRHPHCGCCWGDIHLDRGIAG
jgi:bacteriocin biosynthesis cyclodehydratase domain-containing protein